MAKVNFKRVDGGGNSFLVCIEVYKRYPSSCYNPGCLFGRRRRNPSLNGKDQCLTLEGRPAVRKVWLVSLFRSRARTLSLDRYPENPWAEVWLAELHA